MINRRNLSFNITIRVKISVDETSNIMYPAVLYLPTLVYEMSKQTHLYKNSGLNQPMETSLHL